MTKTRFLETRRPVWERFHALLERAERARVPPFSGDEVSEFSRLFRSLCYDLATVRSHDWGRDLERYLNDLVARGHNNFYRSPPGRPREVLRFFTEEFPQLLRANIRYFWVSLVCLYLPGTVCGVMVWRDPSLAGRMMSGTQQVMYEDMYSGQRRAEDRGGMEGAMAGFYVQHNGTIAIQCFAWGVFFGVGAIWVLVSNSISIGAVAGLLTARGHGERFWSFVISHGSFELTAIVVAGAAGMVIGHALIDPGEHTRAIALKRRGLVGVKLAVGAVAMLAVAALIEAFWSPSAAPSLAKYIVGAVLWVLVILYLCLAGRGARAE